MSGNDCRVGVKTSLTVFFVLQCKKGFGIVGIDKDLLKRK